MGLIRSLVEGQLTVHSLRTGLVALAALVASCRARTPTHPCRPKESHAGLDSTVAIRPNSNLWIVRFHWVAMGVQSLKGVEIQPPVTGSLLREIAMHCIFSSSANWLTSQRFAKWSYLTTGSPSLVVSHGPPKPFQREFILAGPARSVPFLSKIANSVFTIWM